MPRTLGKGMTGQDVREIQDALNFHIRRLNRLQVDGNFGPKTDGRVREFQNVNGLVADGLVGGKTRAMLFGFKHRQISLGILPTASLSVNLFSSDGVGLAANAEYTLKVVRDQRAGSPSIVVGVWGDLQGTLKFESKQGQSSPTLHVDGNLVLGAKGTF